MEQVTQFLNPGPFLSSLKYDSETNTCEVIVRLKWGMEYVGKLVSFDKRMNIHLRDAIEVVGGQQQGGVMGDILIRCNNILHIRQKPPGQYPSPLQKLPPEGANVVPD